jgi:hypothetical protein
MKHPGPATAEHRRRLRWDVLLIAFLSLALMFFLTYRGGWLT